MAILMAIPFFTRNQHTEHSMLTKSEAKGEEYEEDSTTDKEVINGTDIPDEALGIIDIPSLDINYPIYEGATEAQLSIGIGHLPETADLLEEGNCVLCGHNGSRKGLFFTTLSQIRKGDEVHIETKDGRERTYSVVSTKVVSAYDATVRRHSDREILKLFTCAYHGTRRFLVECKPVTVNLSNEDGDM